MPKVAFVSLIFMLSMSVYAENTTNNQASSDAQTATNTPSAEQTSPTDGEKPANIDTEASTTQNATDASSGESETPNDAANPPPPSPHDPNAPTLAELQKPTESELSLANKELLAKNTELESKVSELTTQVNVLVNERTGQLYLYGALTALIAFFLGAVSVWFILNKKKSNW